MNIMVIDFETYFDQQCNLRKLTIPEYVADPRFHILGLAVRLPNGMTEFKTDVTPALRGLQERYGEQLERTTVACHNANFDLFILNHRHSIRPRFFIDTMLLAHHVHGRRSHATQTGNALHSLAERYGLPRKKSLDFMQGIRHPDARQLAELSDYARRDVEITYALAERLLPRISRPEVELPLLMHTVRLFTQGGVHVDVEGIAELERHIVQQTRAALDSAGTDAEEVSRDKRFTRRLESALATSNRRLPMKPGKNKLIPATARNDHAMQALLVDDDPAVAALARARIQKKGQDQKLARLDTLRRIATATGGTLPPHLVYFGAHTGRFAGGGGFNLQNLGRDGIGGRIRGLLVPAPGNAFVVGDLAQIEARITAWCAGQRDMLEAFGHNRDLYSEFAARTLGREVRKPTDADPPEVKAQLQALRQVGKQAVLGLGFGMGALKFVQTLRADAKAAALLQSGELTPVICRDVVTSFRQTYAGIPRLWQDLEAAMRASLDGREPTVGGLRITREGDTTLLWLHSGRALRYERLRLENRPRTIRYLNSDGQEEDFTPEGPSLVYGGGDGEPLYGGKLTENVTQALARDLLAEAVLRLEQRGLNVVFHVHDEVVVEVRQTSAAADLQVVESELSRMPAWAPNLPVACEVKVLDRYGK